MEHRIQLSTNLLIAVKAGRKQKQSVQPKVVGIKIVAKASMREQKSLHSVDMLGNIVHVCMENDFAA